MSGDKKVDVIGHNFLSVQDESLVFERLIREVFCKSLSNIINQNPSVILHRPCEVIIYDLWHPLALIQCPCLTIP